jgi:tetratricopeptide (TPR) repeat protein
MRKVLSIIFLSVMLPWHLQAQTATELLQKVSTFLIQQKWEEAANTYEQAIGKDVERADIYYRVEVDKNSPEALPFAERLAEYYKNTREYGKAYSYYKILLAKEPNNASYLSGCAESAFGKGKEDEAVALYDKVINLNPNNLRANIFLGSYFFMQAEQDKRKLDNSFKRTTTASSMQKARYKDDLKALYTSGYHKAKNYLENVVKLFPSTEAKKMLITIAEREKEME